MNNICFPFPFAVLFLLLLPALGAAAAPSSVSAPSADERCPVCGMFVAKYPEWVTRLVLADGKAYFFDGVKDMMAFSFESTRYGVKKQPVREVRVKDYYRLTWLDGRKAFYVLGSDIHGPMGHEFIPFGSKAAAENFLKDHKGSRILGFGEITPALVESMRHNQRMR